MNLMLISYAFVSIAGLVVFYYLMILRKGCPQRLLGERFKMPDVRMRYTPDQLYQTFESAGEDKRPLMRLYWLYDFGLMACLTGVMIAVTANLVSQNVWTFYVMLIIAVARTAVDAVEDLLFLHLLKHYPQRKDGLARLASAATTVKHSLLIVWLAFLFILLFLAAFQL